MKDRSDLPARNIAQALGLLALVALFVHAHPTSVRSGYRSGDGLSTPAHQTDSWSTAVTALLVISMVACACYFYAEKRHPWVDLLKPRKVPHWPLLVCLVVTSLVAVCRIWADTTKACDDLSLNADIGGVGVLVGIYFPVVLIVVSLIGGHFHRGESGTKEVGTVILANLAYLTFNLLKAFFQFSRLAYVDRIVAVMSIDVSSAGLSMTFSNKDALAARTYIGLAVFMQGIAFGAIVVALIWTGVQSAQQNGCCTQQIWWAKLDSCKAPGMPFWVYLAFRVLMWTKDSYSSFKRAPVMDRLKKEAETKAVEIDTEYDLLPATVLEEYTAHVPLVVTNVVALLALIIRLRLGNTSRWFDWGQSATLVACMFGICHWLYVCCPVMVSLLREADERVKSTDAEGPLMACLRAVLCTVRFVEGRMTIVVQSVPRLLMPKPVPRTPTKSQSQLGDELLTASRQGDMVGISELLRQNAPVNHKDSGGDTPLLSAVHSGHKNAVKLLLEHGAAPVLPLDTGHVTGSAIHQAVASGSFDLVSMMMPQMANIDCTFNGYTLLSTAIMNGKNDVALYLLKQGARSNVRESGGNSPLMTAAYHGQTVLLDGCLQGGVDVNVVDNSHRTALHHAAMGDRWKDVTRYDPNNIGCVMLLLASGADPNAKARGDFLPIHFAIVAEDTESDRMVEILAPVSDLTSTFDAHPNPSHVGIEVRARTAVHLAAAQNQPRMIKTLFRQNADVDAVDMEGRAPIHIAAMSGHVQVVQVLVNVNALLDLPDVYGKTPLWYATAHSTNAAKTLLINGGAVDLSKPAAYEAGTARFRRRTFASWGFNGMPETPRVLSAKEMRYAPHPVRKRRWSASIGGGDERQTYNAWFIGAGLKLPSSQIASDPERLSRALERKENMAKRCFKIDVVVHKQAGRWLGPVPPITASGVSGWQFDYPGGKGVRLNFNRDTGIQRALKSRALDA